MNTLEIQIKHKIKTWNDFYGTLRKQFLMYEKIEGIENWKDYDFSIDCSEDQIKFKDMLQVRFIEELTEASEAILENEKEHFLEEITDSVNFFISAFCMLDINFFNLPNPLNYLSPVKNFQIPSFNNYSLKVYPVIHNVGCLCNLLKNRPWAQSNYLVSLVDFNNRLEILWKSFWDFLGYLGIDEKTLFELIERKYLVNCWRIKTGY